MWLTIDFSQTRARKEGRSQLHRLRQMHGDFHCHIGLGSMAVPGNMGGIFHVHKQLGRLPFKIVAEPAIHYAKLV